MLRLYPAVCNRTPAGTPVLCVNDFVVLRNNAVLSSFTGQLFFAQHEAVKAGDKNQRPPHKTY